MLISVLAFSIMENSLCNKIFVTSKIYLLKEYLFWKIIE